MLSGNRYARGVVARAIFRPTAAQQRFFKRIRDYVCAHRADFVDAAALVLSRTDAHARTMDHAENRTYARLVVFGRLASTWDLSHLTSSKRYLHARAILYTAWLLTDPDAGERGLGLSEMERTPMLPPGTKLDDPSTCWDRGAAKWEVFDPKGDNTKAWWRQLKLAWEELRPRVRSQVGAAEVADAPSLVPREIEVLRVLIESPPSTCLVAARLCDEALKRNKRHTFITDSYFRSKTVPRLKPWGLKSEGKRGYSLPADALARRVYGARG